MSKKEKILNGVIAVLFIAVLFLGYKTYDYGTNLKKSKKTIIEKEKIIKEKDENFLKGMKLSYEALVRCQYVDSTRIYGIRHPFKFEEVEFQTALRKSGEASNRFYDFLTENEFKDGKLTNLIDKETGDFKMILEKLDSYSELFSEEDAKKDKKE